MHFLALCLLGALPVFATEPESKTLELGTSESLQFESISQAVSSDGKVVRIRQVNPKTVVLIAKKVGSATVRVWEESQKEQTFLVQVVPARRLLESQEGDLNVLRVHLKIVEVTEKGKREMGLKWPQMLEFSANGFWSGPDPRSFFGVKAETAQGWLRQLMEKGHAKLVSEPNLLVVLGEQAVFMSGGEIPVPITTNGYGQIQQSFQWKSYGLSFKVRPESQDRFVIRSDIQIEMSELSHHPGTQGVPGVSKRTLSTKVNSKDGETIFLSGLTRYLDSSSHAEMPWIADVPIVGLFFQEEQQSKEKTDVLIAMSLKLNTRQDKIHYQERVEKWMPQPTASEAPHD